MHSPSRERPACLRPGLWALLIAMVAATGWAQGQAPLCAPTVPANDQIPIYLKLLSYDRTLWTPSPTHVRIALLHRRGDEPSRANLDAIRDALAGTAAPAVNGVALETVPLAWTDADGLSRELAGNGCAVLYITAGFDAELPAIAAVARDHRLLTLAGDEGYVGRGVAVGVEQDGGWPRLTVDLRALAAAGHQIDARVLRLCRVVAR
ncbi:MAG: YfiR family protein [Candidatus Krumholzibacteriia bacterium]